MARISVRSASACEYLLLKYVRQPVQALECIFVLLAQKAAANVHGALQLALCFR